MDRTHRTDLTFSKQLKNVMREHSLYPSELSRISGVQRSQICRYLNAEISPSATNIRKLAVALGVTSDYLLGIVKSENK